MEKRNKEFAFECVDRIAGEIINTNDEFLFRRRCQEQMANYEHTAKLIDRGDGLVEILPNK